jgi:hypothetical protein
VVGALAAIIGGVVFSVRIRAHRSRPWQR